MKYTITYTLIITSFLVMLLGCYSENIATRHVEKAHSKYPGIVAKYCADRYPPIEEITDSVVFIPGKPVLLNDTIWAHDTVSRAIIKYVKQYQNKVDTLYKLRTVQVVNRANEKYLSEINLKSSVVLGKVQREIRILYWVTGVLGIYTIGRWVLRFWGIKLP